MKYIALLAFSVSVHAANICVDLPSAFTYDSSAGNFDGSITYSVPRVTVNGAQVRIARGSGPGLCQFLKLYFGGEKSVPNDTLSQMVTSIDEYGHLGQPLDGSNGYYWENLIDKITCRPR